MKRVLWPSCGSRSRLGLVNKYVNEKTIFVNNFCINYNSSFSKDKYQVCFERSRRSVKYSSCLYGKWNYRRTEYRILLGAAHYVHLCPRPKDNTSAVISISSVSSRHSCRLFFFFYLLYFSLQYFVKKKRENINCRKQTAERERERNDKKI